VSRLGGLGLGVAGPSRETVTMRRHQLEGRGRGPYMPINGPRPQPRRPPARPHRGRWGPAWTQAHCSLPVALRPGSRLSLGAWQLDLAVSESCKFLIIRAVILEARARVTVTVPVTRRARPRLAAAAAGPAKSLARAPGQPEAAGSLRQARAPTPLGLRLGIR
jgi:hypothetical protein